MQGARPSSPTKIPSLSAPKSAATTTTLWTARLIATLWKLAVKLARKLRRQAQKDAEDDIMYGCTWTPASELDEEASIMQEAARSVVASGVVSLADFEAVTGFRLSKNRDSQAKDDDASSEAATDISDVWSTAGSDISDNILDGESWAVNPKTFKPLQQPVLRRMSPTSGKPVKWVCVGYGRYVKVQE